jgi:hypothetical protein
MNAEIIAAIEQGKGLTHDQALQLFTQHQQQQADLKMVKDNLYKILEILGFIQNGQFVQKANMKIIMGAVMKYLMNTNKLVEDFGFVTELAPLIEKYKDL